MNLMFQVEVRDRQRENERARRKFTKDQTCELRSMVGVPQKEKVQLFLLLLDFFVDKRVVRLG